MKFLFIYSNGEPARELGAAIEARMPGLEPVETGSDKSLLYASETNSRVFFKDANLLGLMQGYVRYPDASYTSAAAHHERFFRETLDEKFPPGEDVANSFASFAYAPQEKRVAIANDVLGMYPIYYRRVNSRLVISSHLLLISQALDCEVDYTGVVQRLTASEYSNFGSRTILRDTFRLLPGECIQFDLSANISETRVYDNSLYSGDFNTDLEDAAQKVWTAVKTESELCFRYDEEIAMGMSGGMDSRVLLAGIPAGKKLSCYTYGYDSYYETKIARRCAALVGAHFQSFPEDAALFPVREKLKNYVRETEAVGISPWFSILENLTVDRDNKIPMALGDSCEAIPGRNIKIYASREARIKTFLGLQKIEWTPLTPERFKAWKEKNTKSILEKIPAGGFPFAFDRAKVCAETAADLEELYRRLEAHDLKYTELLDELFNWYIHSRFPISKQLLLLRTKFYPVCPTMGALALRATSRVHPALRLNATLMDQIFRLPELKKFARVPTAQIPFVGYDSNKNVKLLMWGIRSRIDQIMIKQAARRKNPAARNRLLKSMNWALVYQKADPEVVNSWFSPDFVGGGKFIEMFAKRASQKAHPLTPYDIVAAAGVNLELEHVSSQRPGSKQDTN